MCVYLRIQGRDQATAGLQVPPSVQTGRRYLYQFARVVITKYHKLGALPNWNLLSHSFDLQSEIKLLVRLVPFESYAGRLCSRPFSLAFRLIIFMLTWYSCCNFISSSLCAYVSISKCPLLLRTPHHIGLGSPYGPHFKLIACIKNLSPNEVTF